MDVADPIHIFLGGVANNAPHGNLLLKLGQSRRHRIVWGDALVSRS